MYSRLKHFYKKHRNFILPLVFMLFGFYIFVLEVLLELLPVGGLIMYAVSLKYIKKFFSSEEARR